LNSTLLYSYDTNTVSFHSLSVLYTHTLCSTISNSSHNDNSSNWTFTSIVYLISSFDDHMNEFPSSHSDYYNLTWHERTIQFISFPMFSSYLSNIKSELIMPKKSLFDTILHFNTCLAKKSQVTDWRYENVLYYIWISICRYFIHFILQITPGWWGWMMKLCRFLCSNKDALNNYQIPHTD